MPGKKRAYPKWMKDTGRALKGSCKSAEHGEKKFSNAFFNQLLKLILIGILGFVALILVLHLLSPFPEGTPKSAVIKDGEIEYLAGEYRTAELSACPFELEDGENFTVFVNADNQITSCMKLDEYKSKNSRYQMIMIAVILAFAVLMISSVAVIQRNFSKESGKKEE